MLSGLGRAQIWGSELFQSLSQLLAVTSSHFLIFTAVTELLPCVGACGFQQPIARRRPPSEVTSDLSTSDATVSVSSAGSSPSDATRSAAASEKPPTNRQRRAASVPEQPEVFVEQ
jgi:hypothetical protein